MDSKKRKYYDRDSDGCTKIDHVSSKMELEKLMEKPFTFIPMKHGKHLEVLKRKSRFSGDSVIREPQNIIPIEKEEDLANNEVFVTFTGLIKLDFLEIYGEIQNGEYDFKIQEEGEEEKEIEDDSITNYFHYSHREVIWNNEETFEKYYVIRRMEKEPSETKLSVSKTMNNITRYNALNKARRDFRSRNIIVPE
jgi:hypothetical protein